MDVHKIYELFVSCSSVSIDTRTIKKDAMFFAIEGDRFDGNKFVKQALDNGAKYAIVSDKSITFENCIYVENTLDTLQALANFHRNQLMDTTFIALTGSNGKTTTKELIAHFLSQKYTVQFTQGNYNNHIGVPLTLLSIRKEDEIAVIEMGANHLYEIKELCEIAEPDLGLITNIGKAHIGEFGGQENIFKAKTELYDFLKSKERTIFYNAESSWLNKAVEGYNNIISYQECLEEMSFKLLGFKPKISCDINGNSVTLQMGGKHNVQNMKAALSLARHFGLDPNQIKQGIESFKAPDNRSQWINTKKNRIYLDAYNSNPSSMKAALEYLLEVDAKNKIVILGEMLELGDYSKEEHTYINAFLEKSDIEYYLIGNSYMHIESSHVFASIEEFTETVTIKTWESKTVLLKGSRGMKMEQLVDYL